MRAETAKLQLRRESRPQRAGGRDGICCFSEDAPQNTRIPVSTDIFLKPRAVFADYLKKKKILGVGKHHEFVFCQNVERQ